VIGDWCKAKGGTGGPNLGGEAPERPAVSSGSSAWTSNVASLDERRAEPWSIAGPRLGALNGLTMVFGHRYQRLRCSGRFFGSLAPPITNHFSLLELRCAVTEIRLSDGDIRINRCLFHLFIGTDAPGGPNDDSGG